MTERSVAEIRLDLVRGHWTLLEHDEALSCLERAVDFDPDEPSLPELLDQLLAEVESQPVSPHVSDRLLELRLRLAETEDPQGSSALATSTMAELLEQQGHPERAVQVAQEVLRRRPDDLRAQQLLDRLAAGAGAGARNQVLAELERWLANAHVMQQGRVQP